MKKMIVICLALAAIITCLAVTASAAPNLAQPILSKLNSAFLDLSSKLVLDLNLSSKLGLDLTAGSTIFWKDLILGLNLGLL